MNSRLRYTAEQLLSENPSLPRLITRSSDIHAAGCFALEDIPKGTVVLEYTGERITKEEGDVRYDGRPFTLSLIHISEPTRRTPISYAVFCLKKKKNKKKKYKHS